jgi:rhodanese-related sulfurtransferase
VNAIDTVPTSAPARSAAAPSPVTRHADPAIAEIFARAEHRAGEMDIEYAGAVTPEEAYRLHAAGAARLVDVRTRQEWELVGHVAGAPLVEWRGYRQQRPNPLFLDELAAVARRDEAVLFLCRSGVRSHHAADLAARAGFRHAYNVLEGFEGDLDPDRKRGSLGGWRHAGLPWVQS